MKKILTHLTGIVFVLTILVAGACNSSKKQNGSAEEAKDSTKEKRTLAEVKPDSAVKVYLKEIEIGTHMHLYMSDSKKFESAVIDGLITQVKRGDTIKFMKGNNSRIRSVDTVIILEVEEEPKIKLEEFRPGGQVYYQLILDSTALPNDTFVKYEIHFTVQDHRDTTYVIDPYLRLPKQTLRKE